MQLVKNNILVTGAYGLLGSTLLQALSEKYYCAGLVRRLRRDVSLPGVEYFEGDIASRKAVVGICKSLRPKIIFNAAAYTNVDRSEIERESCWRTNVDGVANLAYAARLTESRVIHVSTDYGFDGRQRRPYKESDPPNPLGFYAKSKLAGENMLIASGADYAIVRTQVLYGYAKSAGPNFVTWLLNELRNGRPVRIVDDQIGQPTLAIELAEALVKIGESDKREIYHVAGSEAISRYDFAVMAAELFDLDSSLIQRIKTADLQQMAPRPLYSVFDLSKFEKDFDMKMSSARAGLERFRASFEAS